MNKEVIFMSKNNVPFRFDYVGSFLRPDYLKARADFEKEI